MCVIVGEALIKLFQFSLMLHVELINVPSRPRWKWRRGEGKKIRWINLMLADHRLRNQQTSSRQFSHSREYVWFFLDCCFFFCWIQHLQSIPMHLRSRVGVESMEMWSERDREMKFLITFNCWNFYSVRDFFAVVICWMFGWMCWWRWGRRKLREIPSQLC